VRLRTTTLANADLTASKRTSRKKTGRREFAIARRERERVTDDVKPCFVRDEKKTLL
jgi:hypothetical protein